MGYLLFLITYAVAFVLVGAGLYNAHFAGPFLRSHGTYEWLADAWLERLYWISQILLVIVAGVAAVMVRRNALNLEKSCSMGLKSGLYAGR